MRNIPIPAGCTLFGNSSRSTGPPGGSPKARGIVQAAIDRQYQRLCRPPGVGVRDRFRGVLNGQNLVRAY
jgi:hypothetical protein